MVLLAACIAMRRQPAIGEHDVDTARAMVFDSPGAARFPFAR
jgi:hypothetical protein